MADRNKEALLEVSFRTSTNVPVASDSSGGSRTLTPLPVRPSGVLLWRLGVGARDRGHPVAEGGREEVVEETLLPPQSFGDLLRPQRQSQGQ